MILGLIYSISIVHLLKFIVRYQEIGSSTERENLYYEIVSTKNSLREEERRSLRHKELLEQRRKEAEAQKERAMKERNQNRQKLEKEEESREFMSLVGEIVRDPYRHTSWDRMSEKMGLDRRYRCRYLTIDDKKEIFYGHLDALLRRRQSEFTQLLKTVDQVPLKIRYLIH
jgi:hypothetical protein